MRKRKLLDVSEFLREHPELNGPPGSYVVVKFAGDGARASVARYIAKWRLIVWFGYCRKHMVPRTRTWANAEEWRGDCERCDWEKQQKREALKLRLIATARPSTFEVLPGGRSK